MIINEIKSTLQFVMLAEYGFTGITYRLGRIALISTFCCARETIFLLFCGLLGFKVSYKDIL